MVDLCKAVAVNLTKQLNLSSLSVAYIPVTASDRFSAIQQHKADLLCEPTSATLSRRELVDFSIATFVDGASLMIRPDGPPDRAVVPHARRPPMFSQHQCDLFPRRLQSTLPGAAVAPDTQVSLTTSACNGQIHR